MIPKKINKVIVRGLLENCDFLKICVHKFSKQKIIWSINVNQSSVLDSPTFDPNGPSHPVEKYTFFN